MRSGIKFKNKLLGGALVLSLGGFLTKLLGAVYRIPLTSILGAEGIGLYQMVFPLYAMLLTLSSTGVPSGISKLIAEGNEPKTVLKSALKVFLVLGLIGSLVMAVFSFKLAKLQGNINAGLCYLTLSPSVLLVSVISCFRGYFQGFSNMKPTAVSQVIEQGVKLVFGLLLCSFFRGNFYLSAALATLSVSISEIVALIYFLTLYKLNDKGKVSRLNIDVKPILKTVMPITLSTVIMPVTRTIESFLILNVVGSYNVNATSLYGLYSGAVESVISLPISLCYGFAVTAIPVVSALKNSKEAGYKKIKQALIYTLIVAIIFATITYIFSGLGVKILYSGFSLENKEITIKMLRLSSLSVISLPLMQTSAACLNALGKYKVTVFSVSFACGLKLIISLALLFNPEINVFGAIYSDIILYFVACFINIGYIIYTSAKKSALKVKVGYA